jgi:hypothetical protein
MVDASRYQKKKLGCMMIQVFWRDDYIPLYTRFRLLDFSIGKSLLEIPNERYVGGEGFKTTHLDSWFSC